jgi:hypothetical protein
MKNEKFGRAAALRASSGYPLHHRSGCATLAASVVPLLSLSQNALSPQKYEFSNFILCLGQPNLAALVANCKFSMTIQINDFGLALGV